MAAPASAHDPYQALRYRDYRLFLAARLLAAIAVLMQDVAVGWQLYERTNSALALGLTGLASVTPTILFALPAGALADRVDRRNVVRLDGCSRDRCRCGSLCFRRRVAPCG